MPLSTTITALKGTAYSDSESFIRIYDLKSTETGWNHFKPILSQTVKSITLYWS